MDAEIYQLLDDKHPALEIDYLGGGRNLDVFRVYRRGTSEEIGQLRMTRNCEQLLRFDLPDETPSPAPLTVEEDEDGDSWSAPGWDTVQGFLDSFQEG